MNSLKKTILPIMAAGLWINISETVRWEFLIKSYWIEHYKSLGLTFPLELTNNLIWMTWGFMYAIVVFIISKKFNLFQTTLLSWFIVFIMLWLVLWNINVLPVDILWYNIPLCLFEAFIAALICKKLSPNIESKSS